jgi:nucleotide-binding universal stress UspA family protein
MDIKRIVVPLDLSFSSLKALEFAADLAKPFAAELIALFVIESALTVVPNYGGVPGAALQQMANEQRRASERHLARIERRYARRGVRLRSIIQTGIPAQTIVELATRSKADLIVMATHGRTGVSRLLMGSVAERVVRTATCPVLTLHGGAAPTTPTRARGALRAATSAARDSVKRMGGRR